MDYQMKYKLPKCPIFGIYFEFSHCDNFSYMWTFSPFVNRLSPHKVPGKIDYSGRRRRVLSLIRFGNANKPIGPTRSGPAFGSTTILVLTSIPYPGSRRNLKSLDQFQSPKLSKSSIGFQSGNLKG